ncbi:MAG TPA: hypothetical protein DCY07_04020 [Rhodospirillaceae bacterium]|nr:hypothetical protein [Rhodospirillaceae bacterium]
MRKLALTSKTVCLLALMAFASPAISIAPCFAADPSLPTLIEEAKQGSVISQFELGMAYVQGKGTAQNYPEAAKWFKSAADQGNAEAQYNLGVMHALGEGMKQDYTEAAKWYRKAADQGNINAQYSLGGMYYEGQGVKKDFAESAKLYRQAASQMREALSRAAGN